MPKATRPVAIDGIEFDALISSEESYSADIPDYPTEQGFMVSDTIMLRPQTLELTLFLSDTPVTWASRFGNAPMRAEDVKERLKRTYEKADLVTVVTSDETYENMGITSIRFSKSKDAGYAYQIPISLKKVQVTQTKIVNIPIPPGYGKGGKTKKKA